MTGQSKKILVVEDEQNVRQGLEDNLVLEGYQVICCQNGNEGLDAFEKESPDLIILDLMMPEMDGLELCRRIRTSARPDTPIMMLTAKSSEVDKVVGLELGADDYLTKPFGMRELFARIKALLRRSSITESSEGSQLPTELSFGEVTVDFKSYRARKGEQELVLSAKEFDLLRYLSSQPDVPVSRDELLDNVWGYTNYPSTRTVDNFIARLRHKVEDVPDKPKYILTVHGVGYKFVASPA
jgi:DNA-binding response OmpR family regulator